MFAEDLSLFFDLEHGFAVEAVFGVAGGDRTLTVIFHDPTQAVAVYDARVESDAPFLMMKESDLDGIKKGVSVEVEGGDYRVERITRDGTGLAMVYLS